MYGMNKVSIKIASEHLSIESGFLLESKTIWKVETINLMLKRKIDMTNDGKGERVGFTFYHDSAQQFFYLSRWILNLFQNVN